MAGIGVDSLYTQHQARIAPGDNAKFLRLLNEADLRLLEFARWRWTRGRLSLTPSSQVVTLPLDYVGILAARLDAYPVDVSPEELEFAPGGPGQLDVGSTHNYRLIDQGLDGDGKRYYKCLGESDDDFTVYTLSAFAPFTLYKTADLPGSPAVTDSDTTRCPSSAALKLAMLAILMEEENDPGTARNFMSDAIAVLDKREGSTRGANRPAPAVRPGMGLGRTRSFR